MDRMTTNSPHSSSESNESYDRLHPEIRRWIRAQGWESLRDIQIKAVDAILGGNSDALILASTASGKTEAAFLPALTVVADRKDAGLSLLYVSPLKALINDQYRRLEALCERLDLPVVRWHGDAPQAAKQLTVKRPRGVALITPESIEALFVRRPGVAKQLFGNLTFIIIDEVHAFMAGPRGVHLAALLKRISALCATPPRKIGLSATIGRPKDGARWLRPTAPEDVEILNAGSGNREIRLQIRGYYEPSSDNKGDEAETLAFEDAEMEDNGEAPDRRALVAINDHLYTTLRSDNNLVFGGSRRTVEAVADGLRQRAERNHVPNEFFPHHGSLAKELRDELELRLKDGRLPTTAVCTSTLELGIDIGSVRSVAQVGAPRSLAALRQRLGRSGRRPGQSAVLRLYVREFEKGPRTSALDLLRPSIVRATAAIRLLLADFIEPPNAGAAVLTGLLHQTLSVIAERGGATARTIYSLLGGVGPFSSVSPADFAMLLRHVAREPHALIEQDADGTLMLGRRGEKLVQSRDFFALFASDVEWRLVTLGRTIGTIPIVNAIVEGGLLVFAGRRWRVQSIDEAAKVLDVVAHRGGRIPKFDRLATEDVHDEVVGEMRRVLEDSELPPYLDTTAKELLMEGRATYRHHALDRATSIIEDGTVHLFPWRGSRNCSVLAIALLGVGLEADAHDFGVSVSKTTIEAVRDGLTKIMAYGEIEIAGIQSAVRNLETEKFDAYIGRELLEKYWALRHGEALRGLPRLANDLLCGM